MIEAPSFPISIFVAGDAAKARDICRAFCFNVGLCVTVTPTEYIYTGGQEAGVIVGLINYPRFPKDPAGDEHHNLVPELTHALRAEGFDASEDGTGRGVPIICFSAKDYDADALRDMAPTMRAGGHSGSHANAGVMPAIAIQERAVSENENAGPGGKGWRDDGLAYTLEARHHVQAVATQWAVRRLMPIECERLQGFPDGWTERGADKPLADGSRYKALGNSMAVPVMRWILERCVVALTEGNRS